MADNIINRFLADFGYKKDEEEKKQFSPYKSEEERKRKEVKKQVDEKLNANRNAIKEIEKTKETVDAIKRFTPSTDTTTRKEPGGINPRGRTRGIGEVSQPTTSNYSMNSIRGMTPQQREEFLQPYINNSTQRALQLAEKVKARKELGYDDTKGLAGPSVRDLDQKLEKISEGLRTGEEGFFYNIKEGWVLKDLQDMMSNESLRAMEGLSNQYDKINNFIENHPELNPHAELQGEKQGLGKRMTRGLTGMLNTMWNSGLAGIEDAAIYAGGFAGTVALAGQAGPQIALPEEVITVPVALVMGATFGMAKGAAEHMMKMEAGAAYQEYVDSGIDPKIAKPIAETVGLVNGVLEAVEIGTSIMGGKVIGEALQGIKKKATKLAANKIAKAIGAYGTTLSANIVEEMLQEGVTVAGSELSKMIQDPEGKKLERITGKEFLTREFEIAKETAISMALLPIGSAMVTTGVNIIQDGVNKTVNIKEFNKIKDEQLYNYLPKAIEEANKNISQLSEEDAESLVSVKGALLEVSRRKDTKNKDRDQINNIISGINEVVAEIEYQAKEKNTDIEYDIANREEMKEQFLSEDFSIENIDLNNTDITETTLSLYRDAEKYGVLNDITYMLDNGTSKMDILKNIKKSLPRNLRSNELEIRTLVSAVEKVHGEIKAQVLENELNNAAKAVKETYVENPEEVLEEVTGTTEETEEKETPSEAIEQSQENENDDGSIISQEEEAKVLETKIEPNNTETNYTPSEVVKVPLNEIHVDPERFQFRIDTNKQGTTNKLVGAEYNETLSGVILLWEDEFGDKYVVNGHHRVELAKNANVENMDARILSGSQYTAEEARATGAMINIAEGTATPVDVAKILRDSNITENDFKTFGLTPNSTLVKEGIALSNLHDFIFRQVVTKKVPIKRAVILGSELSSKDKQLQVLKNIDKLESNGKNVTNDILTELINEAKGILEEEVEQTTLFGTETFTKNYSYERASLVSYVKGQLKDRKKVLNTVSKGKNQKILETLGNKINIDENVKTMNEAEQLLYVIDKTLNYAGTTVNKLFNDLAKEYANSDNKMSVKQKALDEIVKLFEDGDIFDTITENRQEKGTIDSEEYTTGNAEREQGTRVQGQVGLFDSAFANQIKNLPKLEVLNEGRAVKHKAYKTLKGIIDKAKNNIVFNGLKIQFIDKPGRKYFTRKELDEIGYKNYKEGYYDSTGQISYDETSEAWKVILHEGASKDTITEELIHYVQLNLDEIDSKLAADIETWENSVITQAKEEGINIPEGYELFAQALVFSEMGWANENTKVAELFSIPDGIVNRFYQLLGEDLLSEMMGKEVPVTKKQDRKLGTKTNKPKNILESTNNKAKDDSSMKNYQLKPTDTNTKEFKEWFGDSKVVNEDGSPKIMYHGTKKEFAEFKTKKGRLEGYYFTSDEKYANTFAGLKEDGIPYPLVQEDINNGYAKPSIMPVYLSVQNPLVITKDQVDIIEDVKYWDNIYNPIKDKGYDGIILEGMEQVFVFKPTQIKSVYNEGSFDSNNPNIYYQLKESDEVDISRTRRSIIDTRFYRNGIQNELKAEEIMQIRQDIREGIFTREEYRNLIENNDKLLPRHKDYFLELIRETEELEAMFGYNTPIRNLSFEQFVNRFYGTKFYPFLSDEENIMRNFLYRVHHWSEEKEISKKEAIEYLLNKFKRQYERMKKNPNQNFRSVYYQLRPDYIDVDDYEEINESIVKKHTTEGGEVNYDFKDRSWSDTVAKADITSEELKNLLNNTEFLYKVKHNSETILEAAKLIDKEGEEEVEAWILGNTPATAVMNVSAQILMKKAMDNGEMTRAIAITEAIAEKATTQGQAIQSLSLWGRQTPEGTARRVTNIFKKATTDKEKSKVNDSTDKVKKAFDEINKKYSDDVDIAQKLLELKNKTPEQKLAERIMQTLRNPTPNSPVQQMINTLFAVAKESPLPNKKLPDNPIKLVADAITNREEYRRVWEEAKTKVYEQFKNQPDKLAELEPYFDKAINRTFPDSKLQKAIKGELKDMGVTIRKIVREHYSENSKVRSDLVQRLINEAGLTDDEARILEQHIIRQMKDLTKQAKESALKQIFAERKASKRKTIDEKLIELSNLGAMKNSNYKNLVGAKLGMPFMTDDLLNYIYDKANEIQGLEEGSREQLIATAQLLDEVAKHIPPSRAKKIATFQTLMQLLNPKTVIRNTVGNTGFAGLEYIADNIAVPIDRFASMFWGEKTKVFRPLDKLRTQKEGFIEGFKLGLEDALLGIDTSEMSTQFELPKNRVFRSGPLGTMEKVLNIALRATDRAAYLAAFEDSIKEQMIIKGVDEATEEMVEIAHMMGLYRTFQDDNLISSAFVQGKRALNIIGIPSKDTETGTVDWTKPKQFGLGDLILKYPKTPANILARGLDYSPVGAIITMAKLYFDTSDNVYIKQKMFVEGMSRAITGSALIGIGALLARLGVLTGTGDDDEDYDIYSLKRSLNLRDYGINLTALKRLLLSGFRDSTAGELKQGDLIASYDWFQPTSIGLALGADIEFNKGAGGIATTIISAMEAGTKTLAEQGLLTGLRRAFGEKDPVKAVTETIQGIPSSFTPTLLNQVAQLIDPTIRDFKDENWLKEGLKLAARRIPGVAQTLEPQIEQFGDKATYYSEDRGVISRIFNVFLNPAITGKYEPTEEAQLVIDLYNNTNESKQAPRVLDRKFKIKDYEGIVHDITLTPKEYRELSEYAGSEAKRRFQEEIKYNIESLPEEEQVEVLYQILNDIGKEVKEKVKIFRNIE